MPKQKSEFASCQTINVNDATYIQRYVTCGKGNCWCKTQSGHPRTGAPGHGPYWYRVIVNKGRVIHRYKGKDLILDGKR